MYHDRESSDEDNYLHMNEDNTTLNNDVEHLYKSLNIFNTLVYGGLNYLEAELTTLFMDLKNNPINREIHICAYHLNISLHCPFIQYLLYKPHHTTNPENNKSSSNFSKYDPTKNDFIFPHFLYKSEQDILMKSMTTIDVLCQSFYKETQYEYKGYLSDGNDIYMFFDCSHMKLDTLKMTRANDLWLVCMDEIINHRKVCEFNIHISVYDLFHKYENFTYLTDESGELYEMPIVAYKSCVINKLDFISTFGISTLPTGIFGNHYYFTEYNSAIQKYDKDQNVGLIRCILFLGKMKVVLNLLDDTTDSSDTINQLKNVYNNDKLAQLKLRISDYDSNWCLSYNSIYVGQIELDDGSIMTDTPIWVVKKQHQYHIMSTHIIKVFPVDLKNKQFNTYIM